MTARVLLVVESFARCGLLSQAVVLARRLAELGCEPHLCALSARHAPPASLLDTALLHTVGRRHRADPVAVWKLVRLAKRLEPQVVHAWGPAAAAYTSCLRREFVTTMGRVPPGAATGAKRANRIVVAPSEAVATQLGGAAIVIPPGVETQPPRLDRAELEAELGLPVGARVIAVCGRMLPRKRVKELIWAADLMRVVRDETRLVIIGEGPELPALRRFARMASNLEHVRFMGHRADARRLVSAADLFWHAGDEFSPPLAVLEAMAAGVPVVADNTPGCCAAIDDDQTGRLVPVDGRAERARATEQLLKDADARQRLVASGCRVVAERFSAERMVAAYAEVYERAIAMRRSSSPTSRARMGGEARAAS